MRNNITPVGKKVLTIKAATIYGIVKPFFDEKGIDFKVSVVKKDTILCVHIKDNLWMGRTVVVDELDGVLAIIPYLIARPKCISYDGYGFHFI